MTWPILLTEPMKEWPHDGSTFRLRQGVYITTGDARRMKELLQQPKETKQ